MQTPEAAEVAYLVAVDWIYIVDLELQPFAGLRNVAAVAESTDFAAGQELVVAVGAVEQIDAYQSGAADCRYNSDWMAFVRLVDFEGALECT